MSERDDCSKVYTCPHYPKCKPARPAGPMPTVTYDGKTYKVRGRKTETPDLGAMNRMGALSWLCANTYPRGYSRNTNPLRGLGEAISLTIR